MRISDAHEDALVEWIGRRKKKRDWHAKWSPDEPACGPHQWRQRDRHDVIDVAAMTDKHLAHAISFAMCKSQHGSRLAALLRERARRMK